METGEGGVNRFENFPGVGTTYSPTFQSNRFLTQHPVRRVFSRLKFSILVPPYLTRPFRSLRGPPFAFPPSPIHNTLSSFSSLTYAFHPSPSTLEDSRTESQEFSLRREILSGTSHITLRTREGCLINNRISAGGRERFNS